MSFENIQNSLKNKSISWQNLNKQLKSMNVDKQLIAQMRSIFYSFDQTKDMTLSQDEISNALSMLNSLDTDKDGKITGEELKAAKSNAVLGDKNAGDINNFIKALQGQPLDVSETQTTPDEPASGGETEETKTTQTPENTPSVENKGQKLTEYTVQPGDTPERLAKKFGLEGEEAEAFIEHLKKQTNEKGWFMVGQKITLPGDHSEALQNMSDYTEDKTELDNRWAHTEAGRKAIAAEEARRLETPEKVDTPPVETDPTNIDIPDTTIEVDNTPPSQRADITSVRQDAKKAAGIIKEQIEDLSYYENTRQKLKENISNENIAYILEEYSDLVKDIDDEWVLNVKDVKEHVIDHLNNRLEELGLEEHKLEDISRLNIKQIQQKCNEMASLIRKTDADRGYVFTPEATGKNPTTAQTSKSQSAPTTQGTTSNTKSTPAQNAETADTKTEKLEVWKYLTPEEQTTYPEALQDKLAELRHSGIEVTVTPTRNGYKLDLNEDTISAQPNWERTMTPGFLRDKKTLILDKDGNIVQQNQTYNDKEVITKYENGAPVSTETKVPQHIQYEAVDTQRAGNDRVPTEINIKRSDNLGKKGTQFADSLENNKAALMKTLGIDNEQYNNLANIAMGIAEQETHFGTYYYKDTKGERHLQQRIIAKDIADATGLKENVSLGITQIRWKANFEGDTYPNTKLRAQAAEFGITSPEDYKDNPENAAILTMILLNNKRINAESDKWQKRLEENNAKIADPELQMTTNDIIALSWNGMGEITKRFDDPNDVVTINDKNSSKEKKDGTSYARLVRAYREKFYVVTEEQNSRNRADALGVESQGNNGKLGTVIFMPATYTTDVTNSKEDLQTLEQALNNNSSIPQNLKNRLLSAVKKDEIAFGYGLTADEANSITAADAELILNKLDGLKGRISNLVDPARIRKEAQATQADFRSDYLESRQIIVNDYDVPADSIIPALGSGDIVDERLQYNRDTVVTNAHRAGRSGSAQNAITRGQNAINEGKYRGFTVQEDLGVNPYDANGNYLPQRQRELAEYASDVASDMGTSGLCLTGIKATLESAGIIKNGEVVYPKGHKDWGKPITNAKDLQYFLAAHPEKFEEVKYVSLGNGTSRELNASDIKNLPAGYIGVFIPGDGFEDQAGHAFITNGNGQGYADEVDNLNWDDYKSSDAGNGKGEHGTFVIYKLSDNWAVDPQTGKLVLKG